MHIAILGMGNVGTALGSRFIEAGHQVTFCVRDPEKQRAKAEELKAAIGPMNAASKADVIIPAVPWTAAPEALKAAGDLSGKIILDCTNPVTKELTHLTLGFETSAGEEIAKLVPNAKVVKIFNTQGAKNMTHPAYPHQKATMLYAGDDAQANEVAAKLASEIGFEPIYLGPLKEARLLEPLAMTWILLARHRGHGRDFALNVVRREPSS